MNVGMNWWVRERNERCVSLNYTHTHTLFSFPQSALLVEYGPYCSLAWPVCSDLHCDHLALSEGSDGRISMQVRV